MAQFQNHIKIASEGGIQALLRLARARSTDEELQYKAALTVGHLASNAVKLLPKGAGGGAGGGSDLSVGKLKKRESNTTRDYLEKAMKKSRDEM